MGVTLSVSGDYMPLASSQVPGKWETGYSLSKPFEYPYRPAPAILQRNSDGTGIDYTTYLGINNPGYVSNWQVSGERVFEMRYRATFPTTNARYVQTCEQAFAQGATGCSPYRVRYFRPLMRIGRRLYGIQEYYFQTFFAPPGYTGPYSFVRSGGATYLECVAGACLTAFPAASMPLPAGMTSTSREGSAKGLGKVSCTTRLESRRL